LLTMRLSAKTALRVFLPSPVAGIRVKIGGNRRISHHAVLLALASGFLAKMSFNVLIV